MASPLLPVGPISEPRPKPEESVPEQKTVTDRTGAWTFDSVYRAYAPFVWRSACRLGVARSAAEDVMQEVFLVVHRRLPEFEQRTSVRAWLSAILVRVVRAHRRKNLNLGARAGTIEIDGIADRKACDPLESAERDEVVRLLYEVLAEMNDDRREVFVLSELEQLTAPEIAHALQVNVNTVYWRLRTGRREFERILLRRRALQSRSGR